MYLHFLREYPGHAKKLINGTDTRLGRWHHFRVPAASLILLASPILAALETIAWNAASRRMAEIIPPIKACR